MQDSLFQLPMTMGYLRLLHRVYGTGDHDILAGADLVPEDLADPVREISLFQQARVIDNLTAIYGPGIVFSKPEIWNVSIHGAVAIAVISAATVGEGIKLLPRYGPARTPFQRGVIREGRDHYTLDWEVTVPLTQTQWLPMMEVNFLAIRSMMQSALGGDIDGLEFSFSVPIPTYAERARAALGPGVEYEAGVNRVRFPRSWWSMRPVTADPILHRGAINELELALRRRRENSALLKGRVEHLLQSMPDGRLGADAVARSLGISRRTMARRLSEAGTNFRSLLDDELKERAVHFRSARLRRDEIAVRLGYEDAASFNRAWRRWFPKDRETQRPAIRV